MKVLSHTPTLGGARNAGQSEAVRIVTGKLFRMGTLSGDRLLDVGCGYGTFTRVLGANFREIYGVDVQDDNLAEFRRSLSGSEPIFVSNMPAEALTFDDAFFDTVVTIETLEHVAELARAARQIVRVLRPGGELLITVPNRLFPFETHGIRWRGKEYFGRYPLLTYLPWLHRKLALAAVFTLGDLDDLFTSLGLRRTHVDYAWPTFEHGGNPFQPLLRPFFGAMRRLENSPIRMFGTSIIVRYVKPGGPRPSGDHGETPIL